MLENKVQNQLPHFILYKIEKRRANETYESKTKEMHSSEEIYRHR